MDDWKLFKYWKLIRADYQNAGIMTDAKCSVNTVKAVRCDIDS